jgi:hypothetical protein
MEVLMSTFSASDAQRRPSGPRRARTSRQHRHTGTRARGRYGAEVARRIRTVHARNGVEQSPAEQRSALEEHDRPAEHRIILVVDVEDFTDRRRNNKHQLAVRRALYRVLRLAFKDADISWDACKHEDRGDGVFTLAPATAHKAPFVDHLPTALAARLRDHNATHCAEEQIRLRMALHAGEVEFDAHGTTSTAINQTFRLVDAGPLKSVLADSPGVLALIVSVWYFDEVVRHCEHVDHRTFRRAEVETSDREEELSGWISVPDHPYEIRTDRPRRVRGRRRLLSLLIALFRR